MYPTGSHPASRAKVSLGVRGHIPIPQRAHAPPDPHQDAPPTTSQRLDIPQPAQVRGGRSQPEKPPRLHRQSPRGGATPGRMQLRGYAVRRSRCRHRHRATHHHAGRFLSRQRRSLAARGRGDRSPLIGGLWFGLRKGASARPDPAVMLAVVIERSTRKRRQFGTAGGCALGVERALSPDLKATCELGHPLSTQDQAFEAEGLLLERASITRTDSSFSNFNSLRTISTRA